MNKIADVDDTIIKLAVLALGGQGGGVVTDWIVALAEANGWYAQSTSVPGVAQRTGATIYYVEMVPDRGDTPILSLMPAPGDVDVVLAAELAEAGRAVQRGFVTADRTTLIASTHRALATAEKIVPGDGISDPQPILDAARTASARFLAADLERIARDTGSMISASLFGGLAAANVLPFSRGDFETVIKAGGRGVAASLAAFDAAFAAIAAVTDSGIAPAPAPAPRPDELAASASALPRGPEALTKAYAVLLERIDRDFPVDAGTMLRRGLEKVVDFQDVRYGGEYLDRLAAAHRVDREAGGADHGFAFTVDAAKYIANAMAYDDVIRVADLKTRGERFRRIETEMAAGDDNVVHLTEFMHPRIEEVCGTLPAWIGGPILAAKPLARGLDVLVNRGRRVRTDRIHAFVPLYLVSGLKARRRGSLRHKGEMKHLARWLTLAEASVRKDYALGVEVLRCRRLIKGYSDTHARGTSKFDRVLAALPLIEGRPDAADWLARLIKAALRDEQGAALDGAIATIETL